MDPSRVATLGMLKAVSQDFCDHSLPIILGVSELGKLTLDKPLLKNLYLSLIAHLSELSPSIQD